MVACEHMREHALFFPVNGFVGGGTACTMATGENPDPVEPYFRTNDTRIILLPEA